MEYETYCDEAERGSKCVEAKDFGAATKIFLGLVDSDISELDKTVQYVNLAKISHMAGQQDKALSWYDRAVALERRHHRFWAAENKAAYLFDIGNKGESLALYEDILERPELTEAEKLRMRHNIKNLKALK